MAAAASNVGIRIAIDASGGDTSIIIERMYGRMTDADKLELLRFLSSAIRTGADPRLNAEIARL